MKQLSNSKNYLLVEDGILNKDNTRFEKFLRVDVKKNKLDLFVVKSSDEPIVIYYCGKNKEKLLTNVSIKENCSATLFEVFDSDYETITEIRLEENSSLVHTKILGKNKKLNDKQDILINNKTNCLLRNNSRYDNFSLMNESSGNSLTVNLAEEGATVKLNGLYVLKNKSLGENYTKVQHNASNTKSSQVYKGILNNESCAKFDGKIIVSKGINNVDSSQTNKNLLLTKNAKVVSIPNLEIHSDDVKCSHGSATGMIDEEQIFYLESRGMNRKSAISILIRAFANDVVQDIKNPYVKSVINDLVGEYYV